MENKNNLIQSLQNKIKQVVNPYYISELEIAIKESLNPQLSQKSVSKNLIYIIKFNNSDLIFPRL